MAKWIWRLIAAGIALGIIALIALKLFQVQIANVIFVRTADQLVGADQTAGLEDGIHVYFCGTGSPVPDPTRAGPCLGVLAGKTALVFDAGSGSMRKLARMGFPVGEIEQVFLTHLHSDHIDGVGELMLQAWIAGSRTTPVPIAGPEGTSLIVSGFVDAYTIDAGYRTAHHGEEIANPAGFGAVASDLTLPSDRTETVWEDNGVRVSAFLVNHEPVSPAFGYRIDYKGRSVTISGDTIDSPAVTEAARDTDLLVHEALNRDMVRLLSEAAARNGNPALSQVFADILDYHTSPVEAAQTAETSGAKALVLTHIVPPLPTRFLYPAFLDGAGGAYDGPLKVGEDGLLVSLPVEDDAIRYKSLLD